MIEAIVLAAGGSTRMGQPKAALALADGQTFLTRIVGTLVAAGFPRVAVVTGAHEQAVRAAWTGEPDRVRFVSNPQWNQGQLSSLLAGLDAVDTPALEAVLVTLVDVPLVTAATVEVIVDVWRRTRAPIVRPVRGVDHGHPVVFDRIILPELRAADPGAGAKPVIRAHAADTVDVAVDDDGAFRDADTPGDYQALLRASRG